MTDFPVLEESTFVALAAHGMAGVWGTVSLGFLTVIRVVKL